MLTLFFCKLKERVTQHKVLWPEVPSPTIEASVQPIVPNQPFVKSIGQEWSGIFFWKFQDKNIPGWFLDITGDSWPQIQSAMRTCGHEMVSQAKRFCFSQELPGTEGAARAEPSLLELCRVASEEDEVNNQESSWNIFYKFRKKHSWQIPGHFADAF